MEQQKDYFDNDVPEHLKEIMETKGIHRDILEVRNLKAVTELCVKTTKNLKYQNITNLLYAVAGSVITFAITTNYSKPNNLNINNVEFKQYKDSIQIEVNKLHNELNKLITHSDLKKLK